MFNVDLVYQGKIVLCKAFISKVDALKFVASIEDGLCFGCKIDLLERLDGEYVYINSWSH